MQNPINDSNQDSWADEDFVDSSRSDVVEDDPWADSPNDGSEFTASYARTVVGPLHPSVDAAAVADRASDGDGNDAGIDASPVVQSIDAREFRTINALTDGAEFDEPATPDEIEDDFYFTDLEDDGLDAGPDFAFDEPEPLEEFDSELSESLYESDGDHRDLSRKLELDALIASIERVTNDQRDQIFEILSAFSGRRLGSWLRWLRGKEWGQVTAYYCSSNSPTHGKRNRSGGCPSFGPAGLMIG